METPIINPEEELSAAPVPEELEADARPDAERERDEYKDGWMRAKADLANHKRQEAERVTRAVAAGMSGIAEDLLLVLDSFGLALATLKDDAAGAQGMRMIQSQLLDVIKPYGIERIAPAELVGKEFDPALAEAIGFKPSEHPEGHVDSVVQDGYRMRETILRPARVYLAAAPTQS